MQERNWWRLSNAFSVGIISIISFIVLHASENYHPREDRIIDTQTATSQIRSIASKKIGNATIDLAIPTGIYIETFSFINASEVRVTGYVWQEYHSGKHMETERGFVLPDAVFGTFESGKPSYSQKTEEGEILGWAFNSILRQNFNYADYPIDHKMVSIRILHKEFEKNIALVPFTSSYASMTKGRKIGINEQIILDDWRIKESYFTFENKHYDANFGIPNHPRSEAVPELVFRIPLARKVLDAFLVNLIPVISIWILLFSLVLMTTGEEQKNKAFELSVSTCIELCSAVFFIIIMFFHLQMREQFAGSGIVYLEWCYLFTYVLILLVAANSYFLSIDQSKNNSSAFFKWIRYRDNLFPELCFWPGISVAMLVNTMAFFVL